MVKVCWRFISRVKVKNCRNVNSFNDPTLHRRLNNSSSFGWVNFIRIVSGQLPSEYGVRCNVIDDITYELSSS